MQQQQQQTISISNTLQTIQYILKAQPELFSKLLLIWKYIIDTNKSKSKLNDFYENGFYITPNFQQLYYLLSYKSEDNSQRQYKIVRGLLIHILKQKIRRIDLSQSIQIEQNNLLAPIFNAYLKIEELEQIIMIFPVSIAYLAIRDRNKLLAITNQNFCSLSFEEKVILLQKLIKLNQQDQLKNYKKQYNNQKQKQIVKEQSKDIKSNKCIDEKYYLRIIGQQKKIMYFEIFSLTKIIGSFNQGTQNWKILTIKQIQNLIKRILQEQIQNEFTLTFLERLDSFLNNCKICENKNETKKKQAIRLELLAQSDHSSLLRNYFQNLLIDIEEQFTQLISHDNMKWGTKIQRENYIKQIFTMVGSEQIYTGYKKFIDILSIVKYKYVGPKCDQPIYLQSQLQSKSKSKSRQKGKKSSKFAKISFNFYDDYWKNRRIFKDSQQKDGKCIRVHKIITQFQNSFKQTHKLCYLYIALLLMLKKFSQQVSKLIKKKATTIKKKQKGKQLKLKSLSTQIYLEDQSQMEQNQNMMLLSDESCQDFNLIEK